MYMSIVCPVLTSSNRSLQFSGLFVRFRSSKWRSICPRVSFVQQTVLRRSSTAFVGLRRIRTGVTSAYLPHLSTGIRWFSDNEREKNDNGEIERLRGFVFRVPNPLAWLKDKWYTYRIQSVVDSSFNLREFQTGAKQALSFLTRLMVMKDFETLKTVATEEAVEKIRQLISPWSPEQQQSIEILVDEISFASAAINSLVIRPECYNVSVDFMCIALKRYKMRPLLIHVSVRFMREYGMATAGDWLISDVCEFQVREMIPSKSSDQSPK